MISTNISGILQFVIGLIISLKDFSGRTDELQSLVIWIAVAFLGITYSLIATLVLIPIYMRLKSKLEEDN